MEKKQPITIQEFLNKVEENESKKIKVTHIEIPELGLVEFVRPREGVLLDYLDDTVKAIDITTEKTFEEEEKNEEDFETLEMEEKSKVILKMQKENSKVDMKLLVKASEKLVYRCCPIMQSKEVRNRFKLISPYEIPTQILGMNAVNDLAQKLSGIFDGIKTQEKVNEAIKN
ncbi:hypothetical protein H3N56_03785 [Cetobacterium sp. 2A]|uniref:hypothetical protein n=1 Tax=unclassified Cetobacterium TaxID=2630983 RepID=UPI00163BC794|nr:hypothetical protein [Cetobacterium sp. 2A]MBC2855248.1 hypothetical protein [Cetobacterium sp. 2A]MBC2855296.1 hypothetical protein [Cetobacterium sp. 2A]MBC2855618.1 hypothetical protein [Cetobacterium sp. 2A]